MSEEEVTIKYMSCEVTSGGSLYGCREPEDVQPPVYRVLPANKIEFFHFTKNGVEFVAEKSGDTWFVYHWVPSSLSATLYDTAEDANAAARDRATMRCQNAALHCERMAEAYSRAAIALRDNVAAIKEQAR